MEQRTQIEWSEDRIFEKDGVAVVIKKAITGKYTRYSYALLTRRGERLVPFFPVMQLTTDNPAKVVIARLAKTIAELTAEAEDYCQSELQLKKDEWLNSKIECDQNRAKKQERFGSTTVQRHPDTIRTGKTEREKNKHRKAS